MMERECPPLETEKEENECTTHEAEKEEQDPWIKVPRRRKK